MEVFVIYVCTTIKAFVPSEKQFFKFLLSVHFYHASPVHRYFLEDLVLLNFSERKIQAINTGGKIL